MQNDSLAELQTRLQHFLLDKETDVSHLTLATPAFSHEERLQIYHDAYRIRLIDCLQKDFPALEKTLGSDQFTEIALHYINAHPSKHTSLRWLGEQFPQYLRETNVRPDKIFIHELAAFEWAQVTAFDAADTRPIQLEDLKNLSPERWMSLRIEFHPSVQLVDFFSNAPALWHSLINSENAITPEINTEKHTWLVWREELQIFYRPVAIAEASAIHTFMNKQTFSDLCEGLCEWFDEEVIPQNAARFLQQWILAGLVVGIMTSELDGV